MWFRLRWWRSSALVSISVELADRDGEVRWSDRVQVADGDTLRVALDGFADVPSVDGDEQEVA